MNEQQPILLTGIFLPSVEETELLYSLGGMTGPIYLPELSADSEEDIKANIEHFKTFCTKNEIEFRIHNNAVENVVKELKKESRYADLLVIASELFYSNLGTERQHEYLLHVLHNSECPTLLIPEHYSFPENLIITFDGSASSVYALKQFAYLFPGMVTLNTLLVYATTNKDFPDWDYIEELVARHYENLTIFKLIAEPHKYFETWLMDNKNPMVIAGAYSRSFISEILKKSFVNEIIEDHNIPVFIAHN
jgi:hypothetical protein